MTRTEPVIPIYGDDGQMLNAHIDAHIPGNISFFFPTSSQRGSWTPSKTTRRNFYTLTAAAGYTNWAGLLTQGYHWAPIWDNLPRTLWAYRTVTGRMAGAAPAAAMTVDGILRNELTPIEAAYDFSAAVGSGELAMQAMRLPNVGGLWGLAGKLGLAGIIFASPSAVRTWVMDTFGVSDLNAKAQNEYLQEASLGALPPSTFLLSNGDRGV